jgi:hypothetical protein
MKKQQEKIPELKKVLSDKEVLTQYHENKSNPTVDPLDNAKIRATEIITNLRILEKENAKASPEKQKINQRNTATNRQKRVKDVTNI